MEYYDKGVMNMNEIRRDIFDVVKFKDKECEIRVRKILSRIQLCDDGNRISYRIKEINDLVSDAIEISIKNPFVSSTDECEKLCSSLDDIYHKIMDVMKEFRKRH